MYIIEYINQFQRRIVIINKRIVYIYAIDRNVF